MKTPPKWCEKRFGGWNVSSVGIGYWSFVNWLLVIGLPAAALAKAGYWGMLIQFTAVALAYLAGSIPFGLLIARARGVDIRKVGSGNIGATNVFRMVGKAWGIATFACDALKGFIPAYLFPILVVKAGVPDPLPALGVICGFCAILGHNFPVFLRFKGGKGIATSAGVLIGVAPMAVVVGLATWIALLLATRYVSVASIGAAVAVPIAAWLLYGSSDRVTPSLLTVLGVLAVWRHRSNIERLAKGTEHRFSFRREGQEVSGQMK